MTFLSDVDGGELELKHLAQLYKELVEYARVSEEGPHNNDCIQEAHRLSSELGRVFPGFIKTFLSKQMISDSRGARRSKDAARLFEYVIVHHHRLFCSGDPLNFVAAIMARCMECLPCATARTDEDRLTGTLLTVRHYWYQVASRVPFFGKSKNTGTLNTNHCFTTDIAFEGKLPYMSNVGRAIMKHEFDLESLSALQIVDANIVYGEIAYINLIVSSTRLLYGCLVSNFTKRTEAIIQDIFHLMFDLSVVLRSHISSHVFPLKLPILFRLFRFIQKNKNGILMIDPIPDDPYFILTLLNITDVEDLLCSLLCCVGWMISLSDFLVLFRGHDLSSHLEFFLSLASMALSSDRILLCCLFATSVVATVATTRSHSTGQLAAVSHLVSIVTKLIQRDKTDLSVIERNVRQCSEELCGVLIFELISDSSVFEVSMRSAELDVDKCIQILGSDENSFSPMFKRSLLSWGVQILTSKPYRLFEVSGFLRFISDPIATDAVIAYCTLVSRTLENVEENDVARVDKLDPFHSLSLLSDNLFSENIPVLLNFPFVLGYGNGNDGESMRANAHDGGLRQLGGRISRHVNDESPTLRRKRSIKSASLRGNHGNVKFEFFDILFSLVNKDSALLSMKEVVSCQAIGAFFVRNPSDPYLMQVMQRFFTVTKRFVSKSRSNVFDAQILRNLTDLACDMMFYLSGDHLKLLLDDMYWLMTLSGVNDSSSRVNMVFLYEPTSLAIIIRAMVVLACLPLGYRTSDRIRVMCDVTNDKLKNGPLAAACVLTLALLAIQCQQKEDFDFLLQYLCQIIVDVGINMPSAMVKDAAARAIGFVICIMAASDEVSKNRQYDNSRLRYSNGILSVYNESPSTLSLMDLVLAIEHWNPCCHCCDIGFMDTSSAYHASSLVLKPMVPTSLIKAVCGSSMMLESSTRVQLLKSLRRFIAHMEINTIGECRVHFMELRKLIGDPDPAVRREMGKVFAQFLCRNSAPLKVIFPSCDRSGVHDPENLVFYSFLDDFSKDFRDPELIISRIETMAAVAEVATGTLLNATLDAIISQFCHEQVSVRTVAIDCIRYVANRRRVSAAALLALFKDDLYFLLLEKIIEHPNFAPLTIHALLEMEVTAFIEMSLPVTLPVIILQKSDFFLNSVCNLIQTSPVHICDKHLHIIVSQILLSTKGTETNKVFQFLSGIIKKGKELKIILKPWEDDILILLCKRLSCPNKGIEASLALQRFRDMMVGPATEFSVYIFDHFLYIVEALIKPFLQSTRGADEISMESFSTNRPVIDSNANFVESDERLKSLKALDCLLLIIGSRISPYAPKVIACVKLALASMDLQLSACDVMMTLVQQLGCDFVGPHLAHIVVSLLACIGSCTEKVVSVFKYLIVDNNHILSEHLRNIAFMPNIPELREVNYVLDRVIGASSLTDRLHRLLSGLKHETDSVKLTAATQLVQILNTHVLDITEMILREPVEPIVTDILRTLLKLCTSSNDGIRLKVLECLGELGAIDPDRVVLNLRADSREELSDDDLAMELIQNYLVKAMRGARDPIVQDKASFAIQEILKFCGCRDDIYGNNISRHKAYVGVDDDETERDFISSDSMQLSQSRGQLLWSRLPAEVQEIIRPYLRSTYHRNTCVNVPSRVPVYKSGLKFSTWISEWIRMLSEKAGGSKAPLFQACNGIIMDDINTALFLAPYAIMAICSHGTPDDVESIYFEFFTVFEASKQRIDASSDAIVGARGRHSAIDVCVQALFAILDTLGKWMDDAKNRPCTADAAILRIALNNLDHIFTRIPNDLLAQVSEKAGARHRALKYYEQYLRDERRPVVFPDIPPIKSEAISLLRTLYIHIDEPDGFAGIEALCPGTGSLQDQIIDYEKAGDWTNALACCEQALQSDPNNYEFHDSYLRCLSHLGHLQTIITHVDGVLSKQVSGTDPFRSKLAEFAVEASWRLSRWDGLDSYLSLTSSNSFDVTLSNVLLRLREGNWEAGAVALKQTRLSLLPSLAAASMESYQRVYPILVKLQVLQELECRFPNLRSGYCHAGDPMGVVNTDALSMSRWDARLKITQPSLVSRELLLAIHRVVCEFLQMDAAVGDSWLQYARVATTTGHFQTASSALLQATRYQSPTARIERAKLLKALGQSHAAIVKLDEEVRFHKVKLSKLSMDESETDEEFKRIQAETQLLMGQWIEESGLRNSHLTAKYYREVISLQPTWEHGHFFLGKYYDFIIERQMSQDEVELRKGTAAASPDTPHRSTVLVNDSMLRGRVVEYVPQVLEHYGKALQYGHTYIYQSLPRMLTLWLDYSQVESLKNGKFVQQMSATIDRLADTLPAYQWYTALSQLTSRLMHTNVDVVKILKKIISKVLLSYPRQSLWSFLSQSKSKRPERVIRANEVLLEAKRMADYSVKSEEFRHLCDKLSKLFDLLNELCFLDVKTKTLRLSSKLHTLFRLVPLPSVLVPTQHHLTPTLPTSLKTETEYYPFPDDSVTILSFSDEVELLHSLMRPKKLRVTGSDGKCYIFLCKPKDDLRKDARMMEFNTMINRLLKIDQDCRRRKLYLRTYAVIPLNEDCGLIEWVPKTTGFRHILQSLYTAEGKYNSNTLNDIKEMYDTRKDKGLSELELYRDVLLPKFPPVFHKWFLKTFPEPTAWFDARLTYARTTAVWSMVGHIVGLGDRHGENILFDSSNGDTVHVDFSCLFDKGKTLECPERVPFRLTPNIVDAFGISGYEGIYRRVCELTMKVLKSNKDTLMNVLETFVHDPLVEWTKDKDKKSSNSRSGKVAKSESMESKAMLTTRQRLSGCSSHPGLFLSVEGQVFYLIDQSVNLDNLSKMFRWWLPAF